MLITQSHFDNIYKKNQIPFTLLVIILDNYCNAACKVCIAKHVFKSELCKEVCEKFSECHSLRCCDHTASDEDFYGNLRHVLETINSPYLSVIVSGGEPTLSPRFKDTFLLLDEFKSKISEISLETNGANLRDSLIQKILLDHKVKILLNRYSVNELDNLQEFNFMTHPVTNEDLKFFIQTYNNQLQVNTILLKKYIPDAQALLNMAFAMKDLGIKTHGFVEILADTTLSASNKELMAYYNEQLIRANDLHQQLLDLGVEVLQEACSEVEGSRTYKKEDLEFTINYCKLDKKYQVVPNNFFRKFLVEPSGEIALDSIEKE